MLWCQKQSVHLRRLYPNRLSTWLHHSILDSGEMPLSFPCKLGFYFRWTRTWRRCQIGGRFVYFICAFLLAILHFASSFFSMHMTMSWFWRTYLHSFTRSFLVQRSFWQNLLSNWIRKWTCIKKWLGILVTREGLKSLLLTVPTTWLGCQITRLLNVCRTGWLVLLATWINCYLPMVLINLLIDILLKWLLSVYVFLKFLDAGCRWFLTWMKL